MRGVGATARWCVVPLAVALFGSGCVDVNFDDKSIVNSPRILAIIVEPPEPLPGEALLTAALVVDRDGTPLIPSADVDFAWTICIDAGAILEAINQPRPPDLPPCVPLVLSELAPPADRGPVQAGYACLPGSLNGSTFDQLLTDFSGALGLEPGVVQSVEALLDTVGLPLEVSLTVTRRGQTLIEGFKRFALTRRADRTTNPCPPQFAVDRTQVSARDPNERCPRIVAPRPTECGASAVNLFPRFLCQANGDPPAVPAAQRIVLSPDPDEPWLETYPVFNLTSDIQNAQESAFYSWFSTGGGFEDEVTQSPFRNETWIAPRTPGPLPLWLVVRDGHLGASACRVDVNVTP